MGPGVAFQLASKAGGVEPHARFYWMTFRPTASVTVPLALSRVSCCVALRDSPAARPCLSRQHSQQQHQLQPPQPWRFRYQSSPWLLPQKPGGALQPARAFQSRAAHSASTRAGAPDPDPVAARDTGAGSWVSFFATCHPGLEQVVAQELLELGYMGVEPSKAGVAFRGRRVSDGYAANLWLRSAIRVLVLLAEGELGADPRAGLRGGQALYDMVYGAAPWHEIIPEGRTFSVEPRLWSCTDISSTRLVWSRVKDAVCDSIRRYRRDKPSPPERGQVADVPLYVSCYRDRVRIFRDMSGQSLHRRGYRDVMHVAALNEAAAAGALALSGWREALEAAGDGEGLVLADPMCGSGTLLIEAALMARDIAPGFMRSLALAPTPTAQQQRRPPSMAAGGGAGGRRNAAIAANAWPFQRWADYDATAWGSAVEEARERVRPPWRGRLLGVDVHEGALSLAVRQAKKAGVYDMLELNQADCGTVAPAATPSLVVCNPPWGARLDGGDGSDRDDGGATRGYDDDDDDVHDGYPAQGLEGRWDAGGHLGAMPRDVAAAADAAALRQAGTRRRGGGDDVTTPEHEAFLAAAWRSLDGFLYRQCPGASATIVSGNPAAFRYLKLKPQSKHRLVLSGVEVQVASYKIRDAASRAAMPAAAFGTAAAPLVEQHGPVDGASTGHSTGYENHVAQQPGTAQTAAFTTASAGGNSPSPTPASSRSATSGAASTMMTGAVGLTSRSQHATHRKPVSPPPPPTPPGDYLDADDGYWLN